MQRRNFFTAGHTALVTGAGSGIGLAITRRLAAEGMNLVLAGLEAGHLQQAADEIERQYGRRPLTHAIDLGTPQAAEELVEWCRQEGVHIDVLVNNAGMFIYNDVLDCTPERMQHILYLHMITPTVLCRLLGGKMAERGGGAILNMASYSIWMNFPGLSLYSATKTYLRSFSKPFAEEMRSRGVSVTAVSPAGVATDLYGLPERYKKLGVRCGILATPDRIAVVALRAMKRGRRHLVPGLLNRLAIPLLLILPRCVVRLARRLTASLRK